VKEEKLIVRNRENHKCFFCDSKTNLTFAHIFYWKKDGGKETKENGVCLCRECHNKMDFQIGCTREEQILMLRRCYAYLVFYYCYNENQEEIMHGIPRKKLVK
jgi:5-methylcytosine-specific restriction endonuclease McrA